MVGTEIMVVKELSNQQFIIAYQGRLYRGYWNQEHSHIEFNVNTDEITVK